MKAGLRSKILLIATAVMLCALVAVMTTSAYMTSREYAAALDSRLLAIGKGLRIQLERVLQLGIRIDDLTGFEVQCREVVQTYAGIGYAMVVAPDGQVLFHSDPAAGERLDDPALSRALRDGLEGIWSSAHTGERWHNAVIPARSPPGEHVGSIVVGFPAELVTNKIEALLWSDLAVGLLVLGLGIALLHAALARFVTTPLDKLIDTLVNLQRKPPDLARRVAVDSDDELGELGKAFNGLMSDLQATTVGKAELEAALSELRQVSDALYEQKERAEVTLRSIADAVITTDAGNRVQYLNPVAEQLTGWSLQTAVGRPLGQILTLVDAGTGKPLGLLPQPESPDKETAADLLRRDGTRVGVDHTVARMHDRHGQLAGHVLTLRDVSAERSFVQQRSWEAMHDVLTGLANRRHFDERVEGALLNARSTGRPHVVCFMDLDQFKVVNDSCGHAAGDELLKDIAALLKSRIRETDTLARLGGDEFALLLEGCPLDRAQLVAADLLATIAAYRFDCKSRVFSVGISIGLAAVNGDGSVAEVLSMADTACYAAKEQGRNRFCVYRNGDGDMVARRREMGWVARINAALQEDRFVLYGQDYLALATATEERHHLEVLLRMVDEEGRLILPGSFIPAAERYNLMPAIDRWVIRTVFASYHALVAERGGAPLTCAINLSGTSLNAQGLLDFVHELHAAHRLPAGAICFEITETAAIHNLRKANEFIRACRAMGILFALDDFGAGTSSFGHLKSLPVDYLKIDGSFVRNLGRDGVDRAITDTINRIGHIMGIKTVAEYAENDALIQELRALGVDYAQGYGVAHPQALFTSRPALASDAPAPRRYGTSEN